jgi:myo-inositol-1(or 4)-monophosphatase
MNERTLCWQLSENVYQSLIQSIRSGRAHEIVGESSLGGTTRYFDQLAEQAVIEYLTTHDIACTLVSEEAGTISYGDDFTLILDPIDGSNNAMAGLPFYCTSLAYIDADKEYGLVRNLAWDEWFEGMSEYGVLRNGRPLRRSHRSTMVSLYTRRGKYVEEMRTFSNKLRCLGSVALEMCYVAQGSLLALVDVREKMRATDFAAGKIIVENAGGVVSALDGSPLEMDDNHINMVASSTPDVHEKILSIFNQ